MEKNGEVRENISLSDFNTKKAEYYDLDSPLIADEENKHRLNRPVKLDNANNLKENE